MANCNLEDWSGCSERRGVLEWTHGDNCSGKMPAKLRLASDTTSLDNSVMCGHCTSHVSRVTGNSLFIIVR